MTTKSHLWRWEVVARMAGARPAPKVSVPRDLRFTGLSLDSRTTEPGAIFVPLKGERFDGHDHIPQAVKRGASGVLLAEDRWRDDESLHVLAGETSIVWLLVHDTLAALQQWGHGVRRDLDPETLALTGSSGKTTTKDLLTAAMGAFGPVCAARASHNNAVGVPWTLLGLEPEHEYLICELGMNHPGEIAELVQLVEPRVALITSVGRAHVGFLGGPDAILRAKLEITGALREEGVLVVPEEPGEVPRRARETWQGRILTFGRDENSDVRLAGESEFSLDGTHVHIQGMKRPVYVRILGRAAELCVLACVAACRALSLSLDRAGEAMAHVPPPPGRMEPKSLGGVTVLLDSYNASPESSVASLEFLLTVPGAVRRFVAFGEMGELGGFSQGCHEEVGRLAARSHGAFFFGPEAKWAHEESQRLGGRSAYYESKEELARDLARELRDGDLLLIKGSRRTAMETVFQELQRITGTSPGGGGRPETGRGRMGHPTP
jgi:UDP-N-acetylmuramoyl-tripeptide--D-alanyl-D-alanine ligase